MAGGFYFVSLRVLVSLWQGKGIKANGNNPFGLFPFYYSSFEKLPSIRFATQEAALRFSIFRLLFFATKSPGR